ILYGGSVNPKNIQEIMSKPDIDGVLIGRASLDVDNFLAMANYQKQDK
ncbi:MAG: triose-phosphate isomerase, partial [Candidatus Limosilactobacillus intestinavium]